MNQSGVQLPGPDPLAVPGPKLDREYWRWSGMALVLRLCQCPRVSQLSAVNLAK